MGYCGVVVVQFRIDMWNTEKYARELLSKAGTAVK